jgi:hypothetical protein
LVHAKFTRGVRKTADTWGKVTRDSLVEENTMKAMIIAAGFIAAGASVASAQYAPHHRDHHPYHARYHSVCQEKAIRLHDYERRAARDGRVDRREREVIHALQRDLDNTCGRYRHRG